MATRASRVVSVSIVLLAMVGSSFAVAAVSTGATPALPTSNPGAPTPAAGLTVAITPSPAAIDSGQSVTLTAVPSGTAPYRGYQWWEGTYSTCSGDSRILGATSSTYTTPALTSSEYFCVNVTDSEVPAVNATSPADLVTVNVGVSDGAISPASPTIDLGQTVPLSIAATGGTAPLTYQWYSGTTSSCNPLDPVTGATSATYTASPPLGTTSYCVVVNDHSATAWLGNKSASVIVTVDPMLTAAAPSPAGDYGDSGQPFLLTAHPGGGTGSYTLQWLSGMTPSTCTGTAGLGSATTQTVRPSASTYYCYSVTDTSTNPPKVVSLTTEVVVNSTLSGGAVSPSSVAFDAQTTTAELANLTASPSGGALTPPTGSHPTYLYQWRSGTFPACTADTNISGATKPWLVVSSASLSSSLYYCYLVIDANNSVAYSSPVLVAFNPALVAPAPTPQSSEVDLGRAATLTAPTPTGGTAPFSYQWFQGSGCTLSGGVWTLSGSLLAGATGSSLVVTPTANSTYFYRVTDSSNGLLELGQRSACSPAASVTVNPTLTPGPPTISPSAAIDLGQTVTLSRPSLPSSEGTPVVSYQWLSGTTSTCSSDANIAGQTGTTYGPVTPGAGTTYYCYSVTDGSVDPPTIYSASVSVTVNTPLAAGPITATGTPSVDGGPGGGPSAETVTLLAAPSGGTGTYSYQWYSGASVVCAADINPAGLIAGATGATFTTPGLSLTTAFCYTVTDQASPTTTAASTNGLVVTVWPQLLAGKATASVPSLDVGQSVTLTAAPTGGTNPDTAFQWFTASGPSCTGLSLLAGATSSSPPVTIFPLSAGTTYYCYRVTDSSNGNPVQQSATSTQAVMVKVYPALTALAPPSCKDYGAAAWTGPSVPCTAAKAGDHVTLSAAPVGGNASRYTFTWFNGTSSVCASDPAMTGVTTNSTNVIVPATPGSYYCFTVSDGAPSPPTSPTYFLDPPSASPSGAPLVGALVARPD
jgi:large repetitive protein